MLKAVKYTTPLYLIFISYTLGIVFNIGYLFSNEYFLFGLISVCVLLLSLFSYFLKRGIISGFYCAVIFFLLGSLRANIEELHNRKGHYTNLLTNNEVYNQNLPYLFEVISPPIEKPKTYKIDAKLKAIYLSTFDSAFWEETYGDVILYIHKDSNSQKIRVGELIEAKFSLKEIENSENSLFDYKQFLNRKQIYAQGYIPAYTWESIYKKAVPWNVKFIEDAKGRFKELALSDRVYSISMALLLGDRNALDDDLMQTYRNVGLIHILCVSGMHLGVFAYMVLLMFSFLRVKTWQIHLKFIIVCLTIWLYAYLTGMSTSVLRAAFMFSFVFYGKSYRHGLSTYRSLVVSALILLIINPNWIYDIGFQLSYAAVLSIVVFNPFIKKMYKPENKIVLFVWDLVTVSISAQLLTYPLILYYFGQFPIYFLLSNIFVTPFAGLALPLSIIVCALLFINFTLAKIVSYLLEFSINMMNLFADFVESLPSSVVNIKITILLCILIYLFNIFFFFAVVKQNKYCVHALGLALIFIIWLF